MVFVKTYDAALLALASFKSRLMQTALEHLGRLHSDDSLSCLS